ncbi:ABC-F family ATP-binding cassette domain-containing protein, partial [Candidatus Woesebacteria bacterium]|nr:ABC-F family ATP-binding cassette domain-containing protein [Candidatus Woesebacteria bacterium]
MLLEAKNLSKQIGANYLFQDVSFSIMPGEKVALIGRNGQGKTTLLKMLSGEDHDFLGSIITPKGTQITLTKQEHVGMKSQTPLEYIIQSVPKYFEYKQFLEDYENGNHTNL